MCVIVDANTLSCVFRDDALKKHQFEPVLKWVLEGKGKFIIGGTKYLIELRKVRVASSFLSTLRMWTKDKVVVLDRGKVDSYQSLVEEKVNDPDFDDPHLPAMVIVSHCMVICSLDARSIDFVTRPSLYPQGVKVPRYYTGTHNVDLLCDKYIDKRYKPLSKLSKTQSEKLTSLIARNSKRGA